MKDDKALQTGGGSEGVSLARRSALLKLGLAGVAAYAAPALLTLSEAEAGGRDRQNDAANGTTGKPNQAGRRHWGHWSRRSRRSRHTRRSRHSRYSY
jgi:hypothetical protein